MAVALCWRRWQDPLAHASAHHGACKCSPRRWQDPLAFLFLILSRDKR
jgi:hypothetical protein